MSTKTIGRSEFIDIVGTDKLDGFEIDDRGVWPEKFDEHDLRLIGTKERAELLRTPSWHQPGDPLLAFRCDFEELRRLFDWYGISDRLEKADCGQKDHPVCDSNLPYGPGRDRAIFEYQNAQKTSGKRNFQHLTALQFGVSKTAIKQAIERHEGNANRRYASNSVAAGLQAASRKVK
ncbi:MAG: hypothetical protein KA271_01920 [Propionivibrio sp.]|jgi:hypothetical protein|nr:hypothetical protein [Propionivibrio sp.]